MAIPVIAQYNDMLKEIRARRFSPVYLLEGPEGYFIDGIADALEQHVLNESEKGFNQTIVYGKDTDTRNLIMAAKRYPMMADYQLIIVKEAQNLNDLDLLETYLENPLKSTVLVICRKTDKKLDRRKKLAKLFANYAMFESVPLRDYQVKEWVQMYLHTQGRRIDDAGAQMVSDYLGTDLSLLANELNKMLILVKDEQIRVSHVEENIGISKDYNIFELQKALGQRNFNKSIQIINYFASDPKNHSIIMVITSLFNYFGKILMYHGMRGKQQKDIAVALGVNPFFVNEYAQAAANYPPDKLERVMGYLRYYDLRKKGVSDAGTEEGQLMIELIVQILKN